MGRHTQVYETADKLRKALESGKAMTTKELSAATETLFVRSALSRLMDAGEVLKVNASTKKVAHHYIKTALLGKTSLKPSMPMVTAETPAGVLLLQSIVMKRPSA